MLLPPYLDPHVHDWLGYRLHACTCTCTCMWCTLYMHVVVVSRNSATACIHYVSDSCGLVKCSTHLAPRTRFTAWLQGIHSVELSVLTLGADLLHMGHCIYCTAKHFSLFHCIKINDGNVVI